MGGRGNSAIRNNNRALKFIEKDDNWFYKPRENSQLYANPIPYIGNTETMDLIDRFYGWEGYKQVKEKFESVNLSKLKSTQAFVTRQGLDTATGEGNEVKAVRYNGKLYLLDGNHRVARAWLKGKKTYKMKVITIERKGN